MVEAANPRYATAGSGGQRVFLRMTLVDRALLIELARQAGVADFANR